jgi:hypothetical protein
MTQNITFDVLARDRASKTFKDVGRSADGSSSKLKAFGKVGKLAVLGMASGVGIAALAAGKLAKNAMDDQAAARRLAVSLRNTTDATKGQIAATENWISKQGVALGVTDDELRPALNRLVTATHDVGKAQRLASLGMNISAGTGKSLEVVTMALAKAQNGNVAALGRLGLKVKDTHGKTKSLHAVMKDLSATFKGQASAAANSTQGKFARLKLVLDETEESIGYKLLPALTAMATWVLNKGIPALSRFSDWFKSEVVPKIRAASDFIENKLVPAFTHFGKKTEQTSGTLHQFGQNFSSIFNSVKSIMTSIAGFAEAFWGRYGDLITKYGIGTLRNLLKEVRGFANILTGIFKVISSVLKGDWGGAWQGIKQIAKGAMQVIKGLLGQLWNTAKTLFSAGGRALWDLTKLAWAGIKAAVVAGIKAELHLLASMPGKMLAAIGDLSKVLFNAGKAIIQGLLDGIGAMVGKLTSKLHEITNLIPKHKGPLDKDRRLLEPAGRAIMDGLLAGIESKKMTVKKALEKVTALVSAAADKISSLKDIRAGFAATFSSDSIFGADMSGGGGISALIAMQQQQATQASQLMADIQKVAGMGLSKSLISQLQAQGTSGADALHALASGSSSQIAQLNALNAQTQSSLQGAGLLAGNTVRGGDINADISRAGRDLAVAKAVEHALSKLSLEAVVKINGEDLVVLIKARNRRKGVATANL